MSVDPLFGPHPSDVVRFFDALARLPMGRVPELVMLAASRDPTVVAAARREAARAAGRAGLARVLEHADETIRRWGAGLLRDERLGVPGYDIQAALLDPADRAAAVAVARDTLAALVLRDLLGPGEVATLFGPWEAFVAGRPEGGIGADDTID